MIETYWTLGIDNLVPALDGFFKARHLWSDNVYVTLKPDTKITAGESKKRMVPAIPDGSRSISLAWRGCAGNLDPATPRFLRGMGSKLWHD